MSGVIVQFKKIHKTGGTNIIACEEKRTIFASDLHNVFCIFRGVHFLFRILWVHFYWHEGRKASMSSWVYYVKACLINVRANYR